MSDGFDDACDDGQRNINEEDGGIEFEFDTIISSDTRFFDELENLGIVFEKRMRYCG